MSRRANTPEPKAANPVQPATPARRRRPWLLAIATLALVAWLIFLAVMAFFY